jgi:2-polyprenyl-3-methyl-5-hydroxy-6-metoxy-1,4-benzoquinol methylase
MKDAVAWHSQIAHEFDAGYARSRAFRERLRVWTELIGKYAAPNCEALDAGCGSGVLSSVAASYCGSVLAFDASAEMIRICCERKMRCGLDNVVFREMQLENLAELRERQFDLILCSSVLEYVRSFWPAFDALAVHLRKGGIFLFSMPNTGSFYRRFERVTFALTGLPRYRNYVFDGPPQVAIASGIACRGLELVEDRFYASTFGAELVPDRWRNPRLAGNLVVYVCRKN